MGAWDVHVDVVAVCHKCFVVSCRIECESTSVAFKSVDLRSMRTRFVKDLGLWVRDEVAAQRARFHRISGL